jgi:ribosomal protein S18 acetylase RimI-like enzyme
MVRIDMDSVQNSISIRKMKVADAEEIIKIYGLITKETVKADFMQLVKEHARKDDSVCLVADLDGRVVGFMISYVQAFIFGIEHSAWIATMGVHPKYMGQGIGRKMALETLSSYRSRGIINVHTAVRWDSTDLLSFFKTLGFERSDFINLAKVLE